MKQFYTVVIITGLLISTCGSLYAQSGLWGTVQGGNGSGIIFKTSRDGSGYEVQKQFRSPTGGNDPQGILVRALNGKLYGVTERGGSNSSGVLYEYDPVNHTYSVKVDFPQFALPLAGLMAASNGKLYGSTVGDGEFASGTIYEFDIETSQYKALYSFDGFTAGPALGELIEINGKLYGLSFFGGGNDGGVIFSFDPESGEFNSLYDLTNGYPRGSLTEVGGKLYGVAGGGENGFGIIFRYDEALDEFTILHDFTTIDGNAPIGKLVFQNGKLYGVTRYGGASDYGTIFGFDLEVNAITQLYDLTEETGYYPANGLQLASNGLLYGTTPGGGDNYYGTLYSFNPATSEFTKEYSFEYVTGSRPTCGLLEDSGVLYGFTPEGGKADAGVIFEFQINQPAYTATIHFNTNPDGANPSGHPIRSGSKLYGLTHDGGEHEQGVLYELNPVTQDYTKRYNFSFESGGKPSGSLLSYNGSFYGTTSAGGTNLAGTIFKYDPQSDVYTGYDFDGVNGAYPLGNLIDGGNGKLYGLTYVGGGYLNGVIYEFDPVNGSVTSVYDFDSDNGAYPYGALVLADNGKLYGMTAFGGENGNGVLFEWDNQTGTYTVKLHFGGETPGAIPYGSLLNYNGKLYGMTAYVGDHDGGTLFSFDPINNSFTTEYHFDYSTGANPNGSLIQAGGKLYGLTSNGGPNEAGVLFEFDPVSHAYSDRFDFGGVNGSNPLFELLLWNDAPVVAAPIADQSAFQLSSFEFTFSAQAFTDSDQETVRYTASQVSGEALPEWLSFNPETRTFHGTPTRDDTNVSVRVTAIDPSGASAYDDFVIHVGVITETEVPADKALYLFPNPSNGLVTIGSKLVDSGVITVRNAQGQRVASLPTQGSEATIDISHVPAGIYLVELKTKNKRYQVKLIKR